MQPSTQPSSFEWAASSSSSCPVFVQGFCRTVGVPPTPTTPAPRGRIWELQGCFHGFQGVVRPRRPHCGSATAYMVHLDYLDAGANIILTASYQATIQGFEAKGFSKEEAKDLLRKSVEIAIEAREIYYDKFQSRRPVLVAASIGSYGAYLADGSEYSGNYGDAITVETLKDFHRERVQILANSGVDLIAFETIPNKIEAKAYAELLDEEGIEIPAWFSFASKDGINVVSGDSMLECASIADSCKNVVAVGINCTPPRFIYGLVSSFRNVTNKPIVIYPNSGETYDGQTKQWVKSTGVVDEEFADIAIDKWCEAGASLFGGCCRTTPNTIRAISKALSNKSSSTVNDDA